MPLSPDYAVMTREARWWTANLSEEQLGNRVMSVAGACFQALSNQRMAFNSMARMYTNAPILGLTPRLYRNQTVNAQRVTKLSLNLIKSVVDTYVSLITKDKPKVSFETSGGDWSLQRKAKLLEKFVDGILYETKFDGIRSQIVRDSAIWGEGIVKCYLDTDGKEPKIKIEHVYPFEILVDDIDSFYGTPQCMYQYRYIDRRALMERYPDKAQKLETASASSFMDASSYGGDSGAQILDQIAVIEAWHLPTVAGEDGTEDGRHVMTAGDCLLLDEKYDRDYFPFCWLYRQKPVAGLWGQSLADELTPLQVEITRLLQSMARAQKLAVGHWLVEQNSNINTNAINDIVASIIRYNGQPPTFVAPQSVSSDTYAHLWNLWAKGFEAVGISQLAANSQKPQGLNSGKAMLVYADVQSQRFQPCYREYQNWHLDIAHQIIHLAREAEEIDSNFKVKATGSKQMMKDVKWADANLEDEEFSLKLYPTNQLADDPAARMSVVQDMINAGMISPEDGKRLLDMPDLEAFHSLQDASYDNTMRAFDMILETDDYIGPEPYMNLQESIKIMQMNYLKAKLDDVPEEKLSLVRRWISECTALIPPPPPPPPGPAPGGPPGAPPGPGGGPPGLESRTATDVQRLLAHQAANSLVGKG